MNDHTKHNKCRDDEQVRFCPYCGEPLKIGDVHMHRKCRDMEHAEKERDMAKDEPR